LSDEAANINNRLTAKYSTELGFSFNTNLGSNLEILKNAVMKQDFDAAILVDGSEGSGKSVIGMQIAYMLDKDHHLDLKTQICFYPEQFMTAVKTLDRGKAIVWDEARRGLNRRRSIKNINLSITDMLAECRSRNLFLIIIMPSFYDMDMNVAVWRSRALVHVWYTWDKNDKEMPLRRGFFRFYNEEGKKNLYTNKMTRQRYDYPYLHNMSFDATFINWYVVDEQEYKRLKKEAQNTLGKEDNVVANLKDKETFKVAQGEVLYYLKEGDYCRMGAWKSLADNLGVDTSTLYDWINRYKSIRNIELEESEPKKVRFSKFLNLKKVGSGK
jgi:hypothetical protein